MEHLEDKVKKAWEEPKFFVHGNVEQITQAKELGLTDTWLFDVVPVPIKYVS